MTNTETAKLLREAAALFQNPVSLPSNYEMATRLRNAAADLEDAGNAETLTVKDAAQRYRVSEETIKRRVRAGELPASRTAGRRTTSGTGGKILLRREDLDRFFGATYRAEDLIV